MTIDPALAREGGAHHLDAEMAFIAMALVAGMTVTGVMMRFVDHIERDRRERLGQFLLDSEASLRGLTAQGLEKPATSTEPALHEAEGTIVSLEDGIDQSIAWWRQHANVTS